jgi:hypothetical protein
MKKGQRGAGTRPCSGSRVVAGVSQCAPTRSPRGVQRGEDPLRFLICPKSGGQGVESRPLACLSDVVHDLRQRPDPSAVIDLGEEVIPVDEDGLHADSPGPHHVATILVAHVDRFCGLHTSPVQGGQEDRRVGFL